MGQDVRSLCQVEARRLVLLIVLVFASALAVQYFELPYGSAVRSIFSAGKPQLIGRSNFLNGNGSMTYFDGSSSNITGTNHNNTPNIYTLEGGVKNNSSSENNGGSDGSLVFDDNHFDPEDESPSKDLVLADDALPPMKSNTSVYSFSPNSSPTVDNSSLNSNFEEDLSLVRQNNGSLDAASANLSLAPPPLGSTPNLSSAVNVDISSSPSVSVYTNISSVEKAKTNFIQNDKKPGESQSNTTGLANSSTMKDLPTLGKRIKGATNEPMSIPQMNDLLLKSRVSSYSMKPRWSSAVDNELRYARVEIENAPVLDNYPGLYAPLYRNVSTFKRSYELMEQMLKVYIYKEGDRPIFHTPVLKGIYASEGWFMKLLKTNKHFVTKRPKQAHLFYLPFSSRMLEETLYVPNSHSRKNLVQCLKDYLDVIVARYSFWNRTAGADHFLVACHDWAPSETKQLMAHCIRALCNSDVKEGFKFGDDVSLPETYVRNAQNPLSKLGGEPLSKKKILAFFAGNMHGYLRPILLQHWENKDPDMKIFGRMPKAKGNSNYIQHMKTSKYCICAKGYEVNSPRVVEAIFYECVPVIISDDFVPPFFDVLNWESFAVFVLEKDIPNLKNILLSIPKKRYLEMYKRVKQVQRHFLWHAKPVKYDIFHMILHSIWYNRIFRMRPV